MTSTMVNSVRVNPLFRTRAEVSFGMTVLKEAAFVNGCGRLYPLRGWLEADGKVAVGIRASV